MQQARAASALRHYVLALFILQCNQLVPLKHAAVKLPPEPCLQVMIDQ